MVERTGVLLIAALCFSAAVAQFDPCNPNPCGPNTDCSAESAGVAKCRCKPGFFPKPDTITGCGPQCSVDTECRENQVCAANKCVNPCDQDICGVNAVCEVRQHRTLCKCPTGHTGDPFTRCTPESQASVSRQVSSSSSDRGFLSDREASFSGQSQNNGPIADVSRQTFSSRPQVITDASSGRIANSGSRLRDDFDPFSGSSNRFSNSFSSGGRNQVTIGGGSSSAGGRTNGRAECTAQCGTNAHCIFRGVLPVCACDIGASGDPYKGCQRGECLDNQDCQSNKICFELKCIDPCPTTCGVNAECTVRNHIASCRCPDGYTGDPFSSCTKRSTQVNSRQNANGFGDLCSPTPCGPNTNCRADTANFQAICSCLPGFIGDPIVGCRRECEVDSDCDRGLGCLDFRCQDPCLTRCGRNADCQVRNNRAVCSCPENYLGDPYSECRPECVRHDDCPQNQACFNLKCINPCDGACGVGAECRVTNHKAICSCPKGHTGHPFDKCRPFTKEDLCNPNPCGRDALCKPGFDRDNNQRPVCYCRDGYLGDPLVECRRGDCVDHEDCPGEKACYGFKCVDPCTNQNTGGSVCGLGARCDSRNHGAICSCPSGTSGDPLNECRSSGAGTRFGKKKK